MMPLRLKVSREHDGEWLFEGLPDQPVCRFRDLSEGLAWAEHECSAAPAQIEIWIDGFYIFVEQKRGWLGKVCGAHAITPAEAKSGDQRLKPPRFGERIRQGLTRWRKSIVANAAAYSGSKSELILRIASVLFSRRATHCLQPGKNRVTSPGA
jgi:hypothetical protein